MDGSQPLLGNGLPSPANMDRRSAQRDVSASVAVDDDVQLLLPAGAPASKPGVALLDRWPPADCQLHHGMQRVYFPLSTDIMGPRDASLPSNQVLQVGISMISMLDCARSFAANLLTGGPALRGKPHTCCVEATTVQLLALRNEVLAPGGVQMPFHAGSAEPSTREEQCTQLCKAGFCCSAHRYHVITTHRANGAQFNSTGSALQSLLMPLEGALVHC